MIHKGRMRKGLYKRNYMAHVRENQYILWSKIMEECRGIE